MVTTEPEAGILDRTFGNLRRAWAGLSDQTRQMFWKELRADLPDDDLARIRTQMTECLEEILACIALENPTYQLLLTASEYEIQHI